MPMDSPADLAFQQAHIHDDRRAGTLAVNIVSLIIAFASVSLRYLSRRLAGTTFGPDDGWICVAMMFVVAFVAGISTMVHYGYGRHSILVTNAKGLVISTNVTAVCYNTSNLCIKISILCLYRRIFPTRRLKLVLIAVGLFAIGQWISFNLVTIFMCVPIAAQWTAHPNARCVNYGTASFVSGFLNVMTDILILASPMHAVWHLKVSKARKRLITVTFLLGGIVSIISIVRLAYVRTWGGKDPTYTEIPTTEVSALEISIGTLAACLPVYRPLYNKIIRNLSSPKTTASHPRAYGQLPDYQTPVGPEPTNNVWESNVITPRSEEEAVRHPTLGVTTSVRGEEKPWPVKDEISSGIMVTREFDIAPAAHDR